jgi:hypothetical protein
MAPYAMNNPGPVWRRARNPEKRRAKMAAYYARNREKVRAYQAAYCAQNAEKLRAKNAAYRAQNAEKVRAYQAAYYARNREKVRAQRVRNQMRLSRNEALRQIFAFASAIKSDKTASQR